MQIKAIPSYQTTIRENNISGRVLRECEISELRDIMAMNFGDWQLFKIWILRRRPHHACNARLVDLYYNLICNDAAYIK